MAYYIAIDGVQQGPFELADLPSRGMRADSLVWTEGMADWKPADSVPEVAALLAPRPEDRSPIPQPPPGNASPANPFQAVPIRQPPGMLSYKTPQPAPSNGFAIASLVLGIAAYPMTILYCAGVIPALLAIIFGFIARGKVKRAEILVGRGMALAGIILGFVYFAVAALLLTFMLFIVANTPHR